MVSILVFSFLSCKKSQADTNASGTIVKQSIDGCTWLIKLDNGSILEPSNLLSFTTVTVKDGQRVTLTYQKCQDCISICMMGEMVYLQAISNQ